MRFIASLALAVLLASACDSPAQPAVTADPSAPVKVFEDDVLSFEYPAVWNQATFSVPASMARQLVSLSTSPLSDPCANVSGGSCGMPVTALDPDGVSITWILYEFPTPPPGPLPTANGSSGDIEVGGRPAIVTQSAATGACGNVGGEQQLLVSIDNPADRSKEVVMEACVRGPNIELTGATIAGMLASVHWKEPAASPQ